MTENLNYLPVKTYNEMVWTEKLNQNTTTIAFLKNNDIDNLKLTKCFYNFFQTFDSSQRESHAFFDE